jgi:hypothetical protein
MFKNDLGIGIQVMLVNGVDFAPNEVLLLDVKDIKAMEIKTKEGNEMALNINGRMKVKTLVSDFKKEFGLTLRVYNGRSFADEGATLASIRKGDAKGGEISPKRNMKVGNLEDKIQELFGIKTQIAGSDDSYLCDNDNTLAKALEVDTKKLDKKSKKEAVTKENDLQDQEICEDDMNNQIMTKKEIIKEIKSFYKSHDNLDEMVDDLTNGDNYLSYWANNFAREDYPQNLELAKALYFLEEQIGEDLTACVRLASNIASNLEDKEWAIRLYKKAEEQVEDLNELGHYNALISGIGYNLEDKEWTKDIVNRAIEALESADDWSEFAVMSSELLTLAETIATEDGLNNKELSKDIFNKAKEYEGVTDLLDAARKVKEIFEDDDWATEYCDFISERAIELVDDGYYCDIYYFLKDDLEDEEKAQEFRDDYEDNMREDHEEYDCCEELFDNEDSVLSVEDIDFDEYDDGRMVIGFSIWTLTFAAIEEMIEDDGTIPEDGLEIVNENISEFLETIKEKLEENVEDRIAISLDGKIYEYHEGIIDNSVKDFEKIYLYIISSKEIPANQLNALFLDMDDYGFAAKFINYDKDIVISQAYDYGEYDTGWFSDHHHENYIDYKFTAPNYNEACDFLLNNE